MAGDINYGAILESLNNKVDLSGSWSAPSSQYIDLSVVNSQYYTASADGCFVLWGTNTNANSSSWLSLTIFPAQNDNTIGKQVSWTPQVSTGNELGATISCKKGDRCYVAFWNTTVTRLRFVYAQKTN